MTKNNWIACIIVVIVVSCACIFCLMLSLLAAAGYVMLSPAVTQYFPFQPFEFSTPTPSLEVIRPSPQPWDAQPDLPHATHTPQAGSGNQSPAATPIPISVPTDTLSTLENTILPLSDPIELGQRLLGLRNLSPTVAPPSAPYQVGARQDFWLGNGDVENFSVSTTLQYITPHSYFWIEDGVDFNPRHLAQLAETFENQLYPTDRAYFGSEWSPGVDGDPHIYIVYARGIGEKIAGYFSSADEFPRTINPYSNQHEMFVFNADITSLSDKYTAGVLAHELQHMILWNQDRNESNWISEGLSELAALLNNAYSGGFDALYTSNPDLQLNEWPDDSRSDATPHYGASFLFMTYLLDRFGKTAIADLVSNPDNDLHGLDTTLQQLHATDPLTGRQITADDLFTDWAITNYIDDSGVADGRFAYTSYSSVPRAAPTFSYAACPLSPVTTDVHQYGVDYIRFTCPGNYTLHFVGSIQAPLLPADMHSGKYALWSNKGDESDTTLSRSFDFTQVSGKLDLSYWTWFDIENGWDYAYLEASTDGENWQILTTPSGTRLNPQGYAYGWGYTGMSGSGTRPSWIHEQVDLSQYAGKKVTLRFEYVTDANVTGEGFLLDDISIPQINYTTGFESGTDGWQAQGWVRMENVLPQTYRLALLSFGKSTQVQYIPLHADITADIPISIGSGVDNVVLVVTATTRFTRQPAPYRFSVTQP